MLSIFRRTSLRSLAMPWVTVWVWLLAAASVAFWVLNWPSPSTAAVAIVPNAENHAGQTFHVQTAKALGHAVSQNAPADLSSSSQFKLIGVIASATGQGSALIAVGGQAPKAYRPGQTVQDGWMLDSLTTRQARLQSATSQITLELPASDRQ